MLSFRKSASSTAAVHGYLSDGTRVNVIGESGNFYKIQHGGKEGYGTKTYIKKVTSTTSSGSGTTTTSPPSTTTATIVWPLPGYNNPSAWGWRLNEGVVAFHNGMDVGTSGQHPQVLAIMAGKVHAVTSYISGKSNLGRYVIIEHTVNGVKYYSRYQHLLSVSVTKGDPVDAGDPVGNVGGSGTSEYRYSPHLHFELSKSASTWSTTAINPINTYFANDKRYGTNINDQPLFKKVNGVFQYNPSFNWNWSDSSLPDKYSHSTTFKK
jgi:murein DD-endopeptidase MepM/ murein hydrolase activator NlpD